MKGRDVIVEVSLLVLLSSSLCTHVVPNSEPLAGTLQVLHIGYDGRELQGVASPFSLGPRGGDPIIQQIASGSCNANPVSACAIAFDFAVVSGDSVVVATDLRSSNQSCPMISVTDSLSSAFKNVVSQSDGAQYADCAFISVASLNSSGPDVVRASFNPSVPIADLSSLEVTGISGTNPVVVSGSCAASCSARLSTQAVDFSGSPFLVSAFAVTNTHGSATTAPGYTLSLGYVGGTEYNTSRVQSPTNFQITAGSGVGSWAQVGAAFGGVAIPIAITSQAGGTNSSTTSSSSTPPQPSSSSTNSSAAPQAAGHGLQVPSVLYVDILAAILLVGFMVLYAARRQRRGRH